MSEMRELEIFLSDWPSLRPHFTRGAIFIIDPTISLKLACEAFVKDDRPLVEEWLNKNLIRRPSDEEDKTWSKAPVREFQFGIVQPYVLIQPIDLTKH